MKVKEDNLYARNVKGVDIYIENAQSGAQGYFCIGCKAEMQAVKSRIEGRQSYFRHIATDVKMGERECSFSSETYRHKLAKSILIETRQLKVPAIYKYPPNGIDGKIYKIKDSELIIANSVRSEITFYETNEGEIKFGRKPDVNEKNLLIKPDIVFFNNKGEPILLVEIVATHEPDEEKLVKIKRLGINAVKVRIPIDAQENIERNLLKTTNTKWLYNNEEQSINYLQLSKGNAEVLLQPDELQRRISEESYECRASEIRNLIRSIERSLESEQYGGITQKIESEISRVERNTERVRSESKDIRRKIREGVSRKFEERFREQELNFSTEQSRIGINIKKAKDRYRKLEERYYKKRKELEGRESEIRKQEEEVDRLLKERRKDKTTKEYYRKEIEDIDSKVQAIEYRITEIRNRRETLPEKHKSNKTTEKQRLTEDKEYFRDRRKRTIREIKQLKEKELRGFTGNRDEIGNKFEKLQKEADKAIEGKDFTGLPEFRRLLEKLFQSRRIFEDWEKRRSDYRRYEKATEYFRNQTYKNWY